MSYRFDVDRWIIHQLPPILRRPAIYAFLKAFLAPVKQLQLTFQAWRESVTRQVRSNAFVGTLEKRLNEVFFFTGNIIYITDESFGRFTLSFQEEEFPPVYMSFQGEDPETPAVLESFRPDDLIGRFIVHVPSTMSAADLALVARWVNYYKMAGTEYTIEQYG